MKKNIIIFCSAPADLQYVLAIYDQHKEDAEISIFVTNVEGIYKFIRSLNLNLKKLVFIPYHREFSIKNPISVLKEKTRMNQLYRKHFNETMNHNVYFYSDHHDWITFSITARLSKYNTIYFVDYYNTAHFNRISTGLKEGVLSIIYYFITGIRLRYHKRSDNRLHIWFPYQDYSITKISPPIIKDKIYSKYSYKSELVDLRSILLFESNEVLSNKIIDYEQTMRSHLKTLVQAGYKIILKPHPRLGYSNFLKQYAIKILPDYIPGEFIDYSNFAAIIGISSFALAKAAERHQDNNVISILELLNFKSKETKELYKKYLKQHSSNHIKFVHTFNDLYERLKVDL